MLPHEIVFINKIPYQIDTDGIPTIGDMVINQFDEYAICTGICPNGCHVLLGSEHGVIPARMTDITRLRISVFDEHYN